MTVPAYPGRLATADEMANDIIASIRYVHQNANRFGVDASKLMVEGISGGGYATAFICGKLAVLGESNLIKSIIITHGVTPGYFFLVKKEDMPNAVTQMSMYDGPFVGKAYATNFDK